MGSGNYNGPLFVEIPTKEISQDSDTLQEINYRTVRLMNSPTTITWECKDLSAALAIILKLQEKDYSFRMFGIDDHLFMEHRR